MSLAGGGDTIGEDGGGLGEKSGREWLEEGSRTHDTREDKIQERFHITVVYLILRGGLIVAG